MSAIVLGAVGAGAGFLLGGPAGAAYGFGLGYGLGSLRQGVPGQDGPRLEDLRFTQSQYGQPIPWFRGAPRISGQVVWSSVKREIATTSSAGGKGGGPEITSYSYEIDVLIMLGDHTALGVTRVFSNGKVVWTRRLGASGASLANSNGSDLWRRLTFYSGAASQLPDPTIEAALGVGNVPGYRGRCTIMLEGLQLGTSGQLPNLTFEVAYSGVGSIEAAVAGGTVPVVVGFNVGTAANGSTEMRVHIGQWTNTYATTEVRVYDVDVLSGLYSQVGTYNVANAIWSVCAGNSDVPIFMQTSSSSAVSYTGVGGTSTSYSLSVNMSGSMTFSRLGSAVVLAWQSGAGNRVLYRHAASGGAALATSAALAIAPQSILIIGSTVYVAGVSGAAFYVLDLATLTLQTTTTWPTSNSANPILFELDGAPCVIDASKAILAYRSGSFVNIGTLANPYPGGASECRSLFVLGGLLVGGYATSGLTPNVYQTWYAPVVQSPSAVTVQSVVDELCARAGMPAGSYDTTGLSGAAKQVRSLAVGAGATRAVIEQLSTAFFFSAALRDKLYFRLRGPAAAATIPWDDLAAGTDEADDQSLPLSVGNDLELPPQVAVSYINLSDDGQAGTEYSDRMTGGQAAVQTVSLGIGMIPAEAKGIADAVVADTAAGLVSGAISLPLTYTRLDPSDVVDVVDRDGRTYRLRLTRRRDERGVISFEVVGDDATAITSQQITDTTQVLDNAVNKPSDTLFLALDIPLLRDADDAPGWYGAAKGATTVWAGGQILSSVDNVTFALAAEIREAAVFGTCTTTLGSFSDVGVDEVNSVTVNVGNGELASTTRDALFADETVNVMLIGDEVLRFLRATLVSAGVYTISGLLRGQRGTEWAIAGHVASERAALLRPQGLRRVTTQASDISQTRYLASLTLGATTQKGATTFVNTGRSGKCLAPAHIRLISGSGGPTIAWTRRTRYSAKFVGATGASYPLGEAAESYVVRIYADNLYTTLIRTFTTTAASVQYPAATLLADLPAFGGVGFYVDVRQVNALGAEGYSGRATLLVSEADTEAGAAAGFVSNNGPRLIGTFSGAFVALDEGISPLGTFRRILTSTDDGASFAVSLEGVAEVGAMAGISGLDAISTNRLAIGFNLAAGIKFGIVATNNTSAPTKYTPQPVVGGQYIFPSALGVDGTDFVMVGTPQDAVTGSAVSQNLYLYRSAAGAAWTLDGQMLPDGADPNALPASNPSGFSAVGFLGYSPTFAQGGLQKVGTRWLYTTRFAAYYTDDLTMLSGWKRCPTGLGEGSAWPYLTLGNLVQFGAQLVISRRGTGNSVSYSADNGATWTALRPAAQGTDDITHLHVHGASICALLSRGTEVYAMKATTVAGTWTKTLTSGLGTLAVFFVATSGANAITVARIGSTTALRYSADSITWQTSTVNG